MVSPKAYEHLVEKLREISPVDPIHTVVELGCGGKQYQSGVTGRYWGIDLRGDVYDGAGPDIMADAQSLPIKDESVDLVFSVAAFYLMSDAMRVLNECNRILKTGGTAIFFDYNWWVAKRCNGKHQFTSFSLSRALEQRGFQAQVHWSCVPVRGPRLIHCMYAYPLFRSLVYLISNWIVISGIKKSSRYEAGQY